MKTIIFILAVINALLAVNLLRMIRKEVMEMKQEVQIYIDEEPVTGLQSMAVYGDDEDER